MTGALLIWALVLSHRAEAGPAEDCSSGKFEVCAQVDIEHAQAERLYRLGCEKKEGYSCARLGQLHELKKRFAEAFDAYAKGCKLDDKFACEGKSELGSELCFAKKQKDYCSKVKPRGKWALLAFFEQPSLKDLDLLRQFVNGADRDVDAAYESALSRGDPVLLRGLARRFLRGWTDGAEAEGLDQDLGVELIQKYPLKLVQAFAAEAGAKDDAGIVSLFQRDFADLDAECDAACLSRTAKARARILSELGNATLTAREEHIRKLLSQAYAPAEESKSQTIVDQLWSAQVSRKLFKKDSDLKPMTRKELESCLSVSDLKNGYLKIACSALTFSYEAAVFKKSEGSALLVVVEDGASVENSWYLERHETAGEWTDVGDRVFPELKTEVLSAAYRRVFPERGDIAALLGQSAHSNFRTSLPRHGTTIVILAGLDLPRKELFKLTWNPKTGRFQLPHEVAGR